MKIRIMMILALALMWGCGDTDNDTKPGDVETDVDADTDADTDSDTDMSLLVLANIGDEEQVGLELTVNDGEEIVARGETGKELTAKVTDTSEVCIGGSDKTRSSDGGCLVDINGELYTHVDAPVDSDLVDVSLNHWFEIVDGTCTWDNYRWVDGNWQFVATYTAIGQNMTVVDGELIWVEDQDENPIKTQSTDYYVDGDLIDAVSENVMVDYVTIDNYSLDLSIEKVEWSIDDIHCE